MRFPKARWLIITGVLALVAIGAGLAIFSRTESTRPQDHICWGAPDTGTRRAKYVVTFDGGAPVETTIECVRVPLGLKAGEHIAVVRAVDALGQPSPPASLRFVQP